MSIVLEIVGIAALLVLAGAGSYWVVTHERNRHVESIVKYGREVEDAVLSANGLAMPDTRPKLSLAAMQSVPGQYVVRWTSRNGSYSSDTKSEVMAFSSKEQADAFAADLNTAFKFIRYAGKETCIVVEKNRNDHHPHSR